MYLPTLVSPTLMPSLSSSLWIREAPHSRLSRLILRMSTRTSAATSGRPDRPWRTFHVQNRRKPCRCQPITVSGLTITRAERQSRHTWANQAHHEFQLLESDLATAEGCFDAFE